jgi:hypothetical protein
MSLTGLLIGRSGPAQRPRSLPADHDEKLSSRPLHWLGTTAVPVTFGLLGRRSGYSPVASFRSASPMATTLSCLMHVVSEIAEVG